MSKEKRTSGGKVVILEDKGLKPVSTGTPMPKTKPPKTTSSQTTQKPTSGKK